MNTFFFRTPQTMQVRSERASLGSKTNINAKEGGPANLHPEKLRWGMTAGAAQEREKDKMRHSRKPRPTVDKAYERDICQPNNAALECLRQKSEGGNSICSMNIRARKSANR